MVYNRIVGWKQDPRNMGNDRVSFTMDGEQEETPTKDNDTLDEPNKDHRSGDTNVDADHALTTQGGSGHGGCG